MESLARAHRGIVGSGLLVALAVTSGCPGPAPVDRDATTDIPSTDAARDAVPSVDGDAATPDAATPDAAPGTDAALPDADGGPPPPAPPAHSSSIVVSPDGARVYVANADGDSVSVIDAVARRLVREIPLGAAPPRQDPATHRYDPAIGPRYLALAPRAGRLYVSAQRSGELIVVDLATQSVAQRIAVGSEPAGVLISPDEMRVYVACTQDDTVVKVDAERGAIAARAHTAWKPWALGWSSDGAALYVTHLLGPGEVRTPARPPSVSVIDPFDLDRAPVGWDVPDAPARDSSLARPDPRLSHGEVRGLYDLAVRPGTREVWTAHLLLGTDTPQPALDFERTVFPTLSVLDEASGAMVARMSTDAQEVPGLDGQIGDVVSGPHAVAFTPSGRFALVLDTNSEDVLVLDADPSRRVESTVLRPLPGRMPEGIAIAPDGRRAYVDERNSGDVAVLRLDERGGALALSVDGAPIPRFSAGDPMPANLRVGQRVFYSANSDAMPVTTDHWVACASCHIEGRSDAVVWLFEQGPRDTPSNAGGTRDTGFLFRTADRNTVRDYWRTIGVEQGGHFETLTDPMIALWLDALRDYVDLAIPAPVPPQTDAALVARGRELFNRADVGCAGCHAGPALTDSGAGNPALDLAGPVLLHDVGTCNTGSFPDVAHTDVQMHPRAACQFDTPTLRGIADSAPYLHDGRANTLRGVLTLTRGTMGNTAGLTDADLDALVEYLRSL